MRRRSYHSSILDDIQLDITKTITHLRTTPSNMKNDIQEVIDNGKGYCVISIDNTLFGYITSKSTLRTHTKPIKRIEEDIAKSLLRFSNKLVTEETLKDFIYNESPICNKDNRTISRIFKGIRRETATEEINGTNHYWTNSYVAKHSDYDVYATFFEYTQDLVKSGQNELLFENILR
jgi:hypothetical protein